MSDQPELPEPTSAAQPPSTQLPSSDLSTRIASDQVAIDQVASNTGGTASSVAAPAKPLLKEHTVATAVPRQKRSLWAWLFSRKNRAASRSRQQLAQLLRHMQQQNLIDADALAMVEGAMQVADMQVRDIMIPRSQMVVLERDQEMPELREHIIQSGHSRFPVIGDSRDEVVGILLAKDMLRLSDADSSASDVLRELLRPVFYVPGSKRLNVLLREFRSNRNHLAIVVDEYGGVAGLVTIEDVLEQIVGDIDDEHDSAEDAHNIRRHADDRFSIDALTPIPEFNQQFETDLSTDEFDTVGGLVMQAMGRLPRRDDEVELGGWRLRVLRADNRRVHLLEATPCE